MAGLTVRDGSAGMLRDQNTTDTFTDNEFVQLMMQK